MVEEFACDGMLSPVLEKEGILGNTPQVDVLAMSPFSVGPRAKVLLSMSQSLVRLLQLTSA